MKWLTELIKHVEVANKVAFALFVASSVLLFGPKVFPSIIDINLEMVWQIIAWAVFSYSGALILVFVLEKSYFVVCNFSRITTSFCRGLKITGRERFVLEFMGKKGNKVFNLKTDIGNLEGHKKLELLDDLSSLRKKGFVDVRKHNEEIHWLTKKGRRRAVQYLKELEKKNA